MKSEPDVYSIETDDSPDVSSLPRNNGSAQHGSADYSPPRETTVFATGAWTPGREDRKSSRIAVPAARQSCELKVGDDLLSALLVDESRGGFAVLIDRLEGIELGKKADLRTDRGWFKVRIVYIAEAAPHAHPAHSDPKCDSWFRLGLRKASSFLMF